MLLRERGTKYASLLAATIICLFLVGWALRGPISGILPGITAIRRAGHICNIGAIMASTLCAGSWAVYHRLDRGLKYAIVHALTLRRLKRALLDVGAGYAVEQYSGLEKIVVLPKIQLSFQPGLLYGKICIRNHIKYNTNLENVSLSSALGRFIVEQQYLSDDENWYIYEIEDSRAGRRLEFCNYAEFQAYSHQQEHYTFFIDNRTSLPLCSMLLVGETGTGKTYALYSLILQLLNWPIKPNLYFVDPKNSSLCVMAERISPEQSAAEITEIIALLERFHDEMQRRKVELKEKLSEKLDADFRHWQMPAHVFIFDEFASCQSIVNTMDKATKEKFAMLLRNIVLQGRQLGFFLCVVMQKSDSKDIPTAIRDNLPWKIVLGSATNTTYITAFEHASDLPKRNYGKGEGLYTYQGRTRGPKIIAFPTLKFDILQATEKTVDPVTPKERG